MASIGLGWIGEPALASLIEPAFAFLPAAHRRGDGAQRRGRDRVRPHHGAAHRRSASWRRRPSRCSRPEATALVVVKPTELFMKVFWPFIRLLNGMGRAVVNLLGMRGSRRPRDGALGRRAEDARHRQPGSGRPRGAGRADAPPRLRLRGPDRRPGDGAAHRAGRACPADASRDECCSSRSARDGLPALPVYRDDMDNVIGILHVDRRDQGARRPASATSAPRSLAREALTVPETMARRRSARRDAAARRARSARDRRVRRHRRPGHVRVADGADRRRPRSAAPARAGSICTRTARRTSTA